MSYALTRHRLLSIAQQVCTITSGHDCSATVATGSDTYEYDDNDSRTRVNEANGAGSLDRHYCHDALDRLVSTRSAAGCSSGLLEAYEYDAAGNRTRATLASPQYFRYSGADQRACPAAYLSTPRASGSPPRSSRATA